MCVCDRCVCEEQGERAAGRGIERVTFLHVDEVHGELRAHGEGRGDEVGGEGVGPSGRAGPDAAFWRDEGVVTLEGAAGEARQISELDALVPALAKDVAVVVARAEGLRGGGHGQRGSVGSEPEPTSRTAGRWMIQKQKKPKRKVAQAALAAV